MALCAIATWSAGSILVSIHWLGTVGILRDYAVLDRHAGAISRLHEIGVGSPSAALTHADAVALKVFAIAGTLWMLRLARRSASYRIGVWRSLVLLVPGVFVFVVTGAMHRTDEHSRRRRSAIDTLISAWCFCVCATAVFVSMSGGGWSSLDPRVTRIGIAWSVVGHLLTFVAIVGGLGLAAKLTARWVDQAAAATAQRPS